MRVLRYVLGVLPFAAIAAVVGYAVGEQFGASSPPPCRQASCAVLHVQHFDWLSAVIAFEIVLILCIVIRAQVARSRERGGVLTRLSYDPLELRRLEPQLDDEDTEEPSELSQG